MFPPNIIRHTLRCVGALEGCGPIDNSFRYYICVSGVRVGESEEDGQGGGRGQAHHRRHCGQRSGEQFMYLLYPDPSVCFTTENALVAEVFKTQQSWDSNICMPVCGMISGKESLQEDYLGGRGQHQEGLLKVEYLNNNKFLPLCLSLFLMFFRSLASASYQNIPCRPMNWQSLLRAR